MIRFDDPFVYSRHVLLQEAGAFSTVGRYLSRGVRTVGRAMGGAAPNAAKGGWLARQGQKVYGQGKMMGKLRNRARVGKAFTAGAGTGAGLYMLGKHRGRQEQPPSWGSRARGFFGI